MNANVAPCVVDVWSALTSSPRQLEKRWRVLICSRLVSIAPTGQEISQCRSSIVLSEQTEEVKRVWFCERRTSCIFLDEREGQTSRQHHDKPVTQLSFHSMQISSPCSLLCQHCRVSAALWSHLYFRCTHAFLMLEPVLEFLHANETRSISQVQEIKRLSGRRRLSLLGLLSLRDGTEHYLYHGVAMNILLFHRLSCF